MSILGGAKADAADLTPVCEAARCSTNTAITATTNADITGATVTFDCPSDRDVIVTAAFDVNCTAFTSTTAFSGALIVDGSAATGVAVLTITANGQRATIANTWKVTLTAGSHTLKLQGRVSAATLTATVTANNSGLTIVG